MASPPPPPSFRCPFDSGPLLSVPGCPDLVEEEPDLSDLVVDSSDEADTVAADAAYDAAVESHHVQLASTAALAAARTAAADASVAMAVVRRRLDDVGVIGPAATFLMASSAADVRLVATEVLGPDFTDASWTALHQIWTASEFAGRRELVQRSRALHSAPAVGIPVIMVAPLLLTVMAATRPLVGCHLFQSPPPPLGYSLMVALPLPALTATTHVLLAATSTQKRERPTVAPLPFKCL